MRPEPHSWRSMEGRVRIRGIIEQCVPQWTNVMEHLLGNPIAGIPQPPSHPIALIVTPLIELGNNHVREIEAVGLKAVSLSAESLSAASREGRNLFEEICLCQCAQ
ncbi:hypothetical protein L208DRAFT_1388258 [Tricholoma matsutake]|nr:hypothetical protein L208DRAFT_1388258 [Tricholoma matsutake 945]